jgi:DNA polymerase delta subunit 2
MTIIRNLSDLKYENISQRFILKQKSFEYQYAPLYAERLNSMRKDVKAAAQLKWPQHEVKNLVDLAQGEKGVIIGTLYKEMKNKPNILKELAEDENNMIPMQPVLDRDAKYIDELTDELILEDDLQRILLIDAPGCDHIKSSRLCSGLVIAVLGFENEESCKFEVEDYCFKNIEFYSNFSLPREVNASQSDKYIVFLSGLELGEPTKTVSYLYKFQLFIDFLRGDFACDGKITHMLANTTRLVVAGNSLSASTQTKDLLNKAKYLTKNYIVGSVNAIKQLDEYLLQLIGKLEVDVMPGEFDPSNLMLPQQPLHHSMFTKSIASDYKYNLHTVTNPYRFTMNETCFLGSSGQFIDDIRRSTSFDDPCELMKLSLQACHLGPTCPDTLACYPYYGQDPFILNEMPDVYFAGNQTAYKHDVFTPPGKEKGVHLISLPRFSLTNSCVFMNLSTLQSEEMFF